jgi:pimeloyl-ACP methyl ester carboxylesterase
MPFATLDGIETRYEIVGDGAPVLMFAPGGFDATLDKWSTLGIYEKTRLLEQLAERYRCIAFDRRETGESGGRVEVITWDHYVAQGAGLLDHLDIEHAHLLGGCMGCCPVTVFAARHPQRALSIVLYWPVGGSHFRERGQGRFETHLEFVEEAGLTGVVELARNTTEGFGKDPRVGPWASVIRRDDAFAEDYVAVNLERYRSLVTETAAILFDRDTAPGAGPEELAALNMPAMIVPGNDPVHTREAARYLESALPAPEFWDVLPEQQTAKSAPATIIEFLDQATASG